MKRFIVLAAAVIALSISSAASALDKTALVGLWQLTEVAKDGEGKPCPFVGKMIRFTADGKMISANMPMPFRYKVNPSAAEAEVAVTRYPELKGMEIMLAMVDNSQNDWTKAPIVYGVQLQGNQFTMKVSGFTPARYKRL
jgi:hypothetical protein